MKAAFAPAEPTTAAKFAEPLLIAGKTRLAIPFQLLIGRTIHRLTRHALALCRSPVLRLLDRSLLARRGRRAGRRCYRLPTAVAPFRPAVGAVLIRIVIVSGIDGAALRLHHAAGIAADTAIAGALGAGGGREASRRTAGIAAAFRAHRLVRSRKGAGTPARIGIRILGRGPADAGAWIIVAALRIAA